MNEIIVRRVDGIDVNSVDVSASMIYHTHVVVSDDNALLADAARHCGGTPRYVNAGEHPILQQEAVSSGRTCFSGERVDAGYGAGIGSDDVSVVIDPSRDRGSRTRVVDFLGHERLCLDLRCSYHRGEEHRCTEHGGKSRQPKSY